ncbi:MAG: bacillithiol biosynthesis cysteine-adding enzyme BshC [Phaeodactylibacter sp.]|uniref:bacillithiol biosynthesis cysteine-adding enzyme BshC n=1 Tax=Phaeodactylibacter sp. TaxID=1940289 RepID=UPI0032F07196
MSKPKPELTRALLSFDKVPQLSERDLAYTTGDPRLKPFYKYPVTLEAFEKVIADKTFDTKRRETLVRVLKSQYEGKTVSSLTQKRIGALLEENTFTVTTAHQPSLFTGPLYYIYKIISTLNLASKLEQAYPDYQFVPLFITGGEDHDFEEVNHLQLFGKTITWENHHSGPVGQMPLDGLNEALGTLTEILGDSPAAQELTDILKAALQGKDRYGQVAFDLTHRLLGDYGLVILDPSHPELKASFVPHIEREIFEQPSKALVETTVKALEEAGFSEQAYPRDINFFYLGDGFRERIIQEGDQYKVLNQDISWTKGALQEEIKANPQHFSPNVVMRPIYQEFILPNLAYIGGGGEIAYWLERQQQFEAFGLNFPMLIRRNSVLFVDKGTRKRLDKLELSVEDMFGDIEALIKEYVRKHTENEISLADEKKALAGLFQQVEAKAQEVDPTLRKAAAAEGARQMNSLNQLEGKLMRAEKQRHDTAVGQMRTLKDKLFPNNGLQERYDNFMMYYLKYGRGFFDALIEQLDPLDNRFVVLIDA